MNRALLAWYDAHRRRLPWREDPSPYRTWVSEIMLQQTQVQTVLPYFERFLRRFPDIPSLARAREAEVLKLWAGLGYYSRAKNLLAAARKLNAGGGRLPETAEELRRLPGIGPYTAGAIASIAFGKPEALVDGNVARVFARLFALRGSPKSPRLLKEVWRRAALHLDHSRPGDWNQALMELGARICLPEPEGPSCGRCPLADSCRAKRLGLERRLPRIPPQPRTVSLAWTGLRIERGGELLLWRRAPTERFLPGHWGLPESRHLPRARPGELVRELRHSITHHRIWLSVRRAQAPSGRLPARARWVPKSRARGLLVSSLWRKSLG